jgi:hypothetical protein
MPQIRHYIVTYASPQLEKSSKKRLKHIAKLRYGTSENPFINSKAETQMDI